MFEEVLALALTLLQRQGWVSYRTLQRRFQLDEATMTALKVELVERRRLAVEEDGARLVWQGELRPLMPHGSQGGEEVSPARLPREVWPAAIGMSAVPAHASPPPAAASHQRPTPLVGREQAVALLLRRWEHVQANRGQVVLLNGEAGIGKSRLVHVVQDQIAPTAHRGWECRCLPYYQHSVLYPVIDVLQRLLAWQPEDTPAVKLQRIEAALAPYNISLQKTVPLFAALLSVPLGTHYPPLTLTPERQKHSTFAVIVELLGLMASQHPVVLLVEDLHWMDASTGEFLAVLLPQVATMGLYLLLTCRPEFRPAWPPLPHLTSLTLNRLLPTEVETLATQVAGGQRLPAAILQQIQARTEGVPLFVEEVTKMVLESGLMPEQEAPAGGMGALPALAIPATVQGSLQARLERLGAAQTVAQMGAVWGRGFTEGQIRALAGPDHRRVTHALQQLVRADIIQEVSLPPQVTYIFKHALIQETAYASLPHDLRQQCHQRVATMLQEHFPETVATQPEFLAYHYTEAGLLAQALSYWQQAGQRAVERSAHIEAIAHLTKGLALVSRLPETPERTQHEVTLYTNLGASLMATRGFAAPEIAYAYGRARTLCQHMGQTPQLLTVLRGLWTFYDVRGDLPTARQLAEQCFALAQNMAHASHLLWAHYMLGQTEFYQGELGLAREHLEGGIALYDPQKRRSHRALTDPGVNCYMFTSWVLWLRGEFELSLQRSREALMLAQQLTHPFSQAFALYGAAKLHACRRESAIAQAHIETLLTLAHEQDFPLWIALGTIVQGWVLATQGQHEFGARRMRQGLEAYRATGAELHRPWDLTLLAEVYSQGGHTAAGLAVLDEAEATMQQTGERFWEAEIYRLQGTLRIQESGDTALSLAADALLQALTVARQQQAKTLELRAVLSLSRFWQQRGQGEEARRLLGETLAWFHGKGSTVDLAQAQALWAEMGSSGTGGEATTARLPGVDKECT